MFPRFRLWFVVRTLRYCESKIEEQHIHTSQAIGNHRTVTAANAAATAMAIDCQSATEFSQFTSVSRISRSKCCSRVMIIGPSCCGWCSNLKSFDRSQIYLNEKTLTIVTKLISQCPSVTTIGRSSQAAQSSVFIISAWRYTEDC